MSLDSLKPSLQVAALICLALAVMAVTGIAPQFKLRSEPIALIGILCALVGK